MNVNAAWSVSGDRLNRGIVHAVGDLDRLIVDARVAKPGIARLTADVRDLSGKLRWNGKAEVEQLDLAQWIENPPVGPFSASLSIQGDRTHYAATGIVRGAGLPEAGLDLQGRAEYADGVVMIPELVLAADSMSVRAHGTMTVAETPEYDVRAAWTGFRWPLAGKAVIRSRTGKSRGERLAGIQLSRRR